MEARLWIKEMDKFYSDILKEEILEHYLTIYNHTRKHLYNDPFEQYMQSSNVVEGKIGLLMILYVKSHMNSFKQIFSREPEIETFTAYMQYGTDAVKQMFWYEALSEDDRCGYNEFGEYYFELKGSQQY